MKRLHHQPQVEEDRDEVYFTFFLLDFYSLFWDCWEGGSFKTPSEESGTVLQSHRLLLD